MQALLRSGGGRATVNSVSDIIVALPEEANSQAQSLLVLVLLL